MKIKFIFAVLLLSITGRVVHAEIILESAVLGPVGQTDGYELDASHFLGARFTIPRAVLVTDIGGHIYKADGTFFGAIVELPGPGALPGGLDETWLAWTVFSGDSPSSDIRTPISALLVPGNYVLVFGSGQFGASGAGTMPSNNTDIPGQASYFHGNLDFPEGNWTDGGLSNTRFVVEGIAIPEIFSDGFENKNLITTVDDPVNSVGLDTSIAIGSDGLPVVSYWDYTEDQLKLAKCNDVACTGGDETITTVENESKTTSIAIGKDGFPVISLRTRDMLKVVKCNDLACIGGDESVTILESGLVHGGDTSISIGEDGFPVIAYGDSYIQSLKLAKCNDLACAGNNVSIATVDSPGGGGPHGASLAIGTDGFPVISYTGKDIIPTKLVVAKCNDIACTGGDETITTLEGLGAVGRSSIAIGGDGFPVIAYDSFKSLKVAKCDDAACTGGNETITTVDETTETQGINNISIAIGLDDNPVISYRYKTALSDELRVAKCNDPACTGNNETITTVDEITNNVGYASSITIGIDGLPVVSYNRGGAVGGALKVLHCGEPGCNP